MKLVILFCFYCSLRVIVFDLSILSVSLLAFFLFKKNSQILLPAFICIHFFTYTVRKTLLKTNKEKNL